MSNKQLIVSTVFIDGCVELVMATSILEKTSTISKLLSSYELKKESIDEIMLAHLLVAEIPLSIFVSKAPTLLEEYYFKIFDAMKDKFKHFKSDNDINDFRIFMKEKSSIYHDGLRRIEEDDFTPIATITLKRILQFQEISEPIQNSALLALKNNFRGLILGISQFVNNIDNTYEIALVQYEHKK